MRIAIIGAGFVGLSAAYQLSKKGHKVEIFEQENSIGGLSTTFKEKGWQWPLETFYHHLFTSDESLKKLMADLNILDELNYYQPKTSIYYNNQILPFDSPLAVLKFPFLPFIDRLRTGFITLLIKFFLPWQILEGQKATSWLKKFYGEKVYKVLWEPLLVSKFGQWKEGINMAWFWSRIKKRSSKLGYINGSNNRLLEKLALEIKKNNGEIHLNSKIKDLKELENFEKILITTSTEIFSKLTSLPKEYLKEIEKFKTIGALNLVLVLREPFFDDHTYWLNINEKGFPFVAVVEHTNFMDKISYNNQRILYLGGYYPKNHHYFKMNKEEILKEFLPYLEKINPHYNFKFQILNFKLFSNLYAQPIMPLNYSKMMPKFVTPIPNVYLANMQQVYPWDREINYAIEEGEKVANEILQS